MPRVLARFVVGGPTRGFPADATAISLEFFMFDDGSCVAAVLEPSECFVENVSASIDLKKTTGTMPVYACRFTLVQCEGDTATRGDVVGWLSETKGLEAQCTIHGDPGSVVTSCPVNLPPVGMEEEPEPPATIADADADTVDLMDDDEVKMLFRGKLVDSNGKISAMTLYLTKKAGDNRVGGKLRETRRDSPIEGTWEDDSVRFRQAYPLRKGVVYNYDYVGRTTESATGTRIVGTWRFAGSDGSQQAYGAVLNGTFDVASTDTTTTSRRAAP